jgi:hypothetical protein
MTRIESKEWKKFKRDIKRQRMLERRGVRYDRIWIPTAVTILLGLYLGVIGTFETRPIHWMSQRRMTTEAATQDEILIHRVTLDVTKIAQVMTTPR